MGFLSGLFGKKKAPPPAPDYAALAREQAGLNQQAVQQQTEANRVNQVNPYGSKTWGVDPVTGKPTQTTSYNPQFQALLDQRTQYQKQLGDVAGGLLGGVQQQLGKPLDFSGLPQVQGWKDQQLPGQNLQGWGQLDLSKLGNMPEAGFGAVEKIRDAMMARLQPGLDASRAAEQAQLRAQGATIGSPGWDSQMALQDRRANDANQQALLGAAGEYGNIFNREMQARQQQVGEDALAANYANNLRGLQFGEQSSMFNQANQQQALARGAQTEDYNRAMQQQLMQRYSPMQEYSQLMASSGGMPNLDFGSYFNQGLADPANIYGAGKDQYGADIGQYNAQQAQKGGLMSGIGTIGGAIIGGIYGGPTGASVGAKAGGALGGMFG